jgi:hypothetical protein
MDDSYGGKNDKEAVEHPLTSVSDELREELKSGTMEGESRVFASTSLSSSRSKDTNAQLREGSDKSRAVKPGDCPGENLKDLWLFIEPLAQELVSCDTYEQISPTIWARCNSLKMKRFHHGINMFLESQLDGLEVIVFLAPKKELALMKEKKSMPSDLFCNVKEDYRKLYNSGKWAPANHMKDLSGDLRMANALVEAMPLEDLPRDPSCCWLAPTFLSCTASDSPP